MSCAHVYVEAHYCYMGWEMCADCGAEWKRGTVDSLQTVTEE